MAPSGEVVITYETLFELYRREKIRDELQKLDPGFFERALVYLKELKKTTVEVTDDAIERNRSLALNIKKLLRDIYSRRERKIINMALIKVVTPQSIIDTATLLEHEKLLFESLCDVLKLKRLQVLSQMENNEHLLLGLGSGAGSIGHGVNGLGSMPPLSIPAPVSPPPSTFSPPPLAVHPSENEELAKIRLQFREDQPKFIGPNLEIYGPYMSGDTAELPKIIADIILETGKAVAV